MDEELIFPDSEESISQNECGFCGTPFDPMSLIIPASILGVAWVISSKNKNSLSQKEIEKAEQNRLGVERVSLCAKKRFQLLLDSGLPKFEMVPSDPDNPKSERVEKMSFDVVTRYASDEVKATPSLQSAASKEFYMSFAKIEAILLKCQRLGFYLANLWKVDDSSPAWISAQTFYSRLHDTIMIDVLNDCQNHWILKKNPSEAEVRKAKLQTTELEFFAQALFSELTGGNSAPEVMKSMKLTEWPFLVRLVRDYKECLVKQTLFTPEELRSFDLEDSMNVVIMGLRLFIKKSHPSLMDKMDFFESSFLKSAEILIPKDHKADFLSIAKDCSTDLRENGILSHETNTKIKNLVKENPNLQDSIDKIEGLIGAAVKLAPKPEKEQSEQS